MRKISADVVIVGGGPAGLAAAAAASRAADVAIIDDNPSFGGQIWRAELGRISARARQLIDTLHDGRVRTISGAQVHSVSGPQRLLAESTSENLEIEFGKLIIATGARERFLPFPGWTLPGVFGAGGLQALVKGGMNVKGKRVVVAGTGPLLMAVAEFLQSRGANVVAIAEQTPASKVARFAMFLLRSPAKLREAVRLRYGLIGVPYLTDCWITAADGDGRLRSVDLRRRGRVQTVDCDLAACGFHLVPNIELARLLQCKTENGFVSFDEHQQTSVENVFCAGEPTGVAGVESALIEGRIAGLTASGQHENTRRLFSKRSRARRFGAAMSKAFELRDELRSLPDAKTIVCRCEDVEYGSLAEFESFREAKLQTRCGMGPCQGRLCGPAAEFFFGWEPPGVRPPIFPVRMERL